jgi:hypothetical protein
MPKILITRRLRQETREQVWARLSYIVEILAQKTKQMNPKVPKSHTDTCMWQKFKGFKENSGFTQNVALLE